MATAAARDERSAEALRSGTKQWGAVMKGAMQPAESIKDFATAAHVTKGEDKWCAIHNGTEEAFYGLFDGHGGAHLATGLAQTLPAKILSNPVDVANLVDAFYEADRELGKRLPTQGSTATIAHVLRKEQEARVIMAWVGDSRAIGVDMLSRALVWKSSLHHVTSKPELNRIRVQWLLRGEARSVSTDAEATELVSRILLEEEQRTAERSSARRPRRYRSTRAVDSSDDDSEEQDTAANSGSDAIMELASARGGTEMLRTTFASVREMLDRATRYERDVSAVDAKIGIKRSQSFVGRRTDIDGRPCGPIALQTMWKQAEEPPLKGASTCVTRSIGDWDSSRTLLPHPDIAIHDMAVPNDSAAIWRRFVLASDGLWDVLTPSKVAKIVAAANEPAAAANTLLNAARRKYLKRMDKTRASFTDPFRDDTTIIVFDVRLGNKEAKPLPKTTSLSSFASLRALNGNAKAYSATALSVKRTHFTISAGSRSLAAIQKDPEEAKEQPLPNPPNLLGFKFKKLTLVRFLTSAHG